MGNSGGGVEEDWEWVWWEIIKEKACLSISSYCDGYDILGMK